MGEIEPAVTAAFEDFELVIETFNEARRLEVNEIVGNFIPEAVEGVQESVKAIQAAGADLGPPVA
jgi:hypothetical protein